jgi:hypothetical protein
LKSLAENKRGVWRRASAVGERSRPIRKKRSKGAESAANFWKKS